MEGRDKDVSLRDREVLCQCPYTIFFFFFQICIQNTWKSRLLVELIFQTHSKKFYVINCYLTTYTYYNIILNDFTYLFTTLICIDFIAYSLINNNFCIVNLKKKWDYKSTHYHLFPKVYFYKVGLVSTTKRVQHITIQ